jgi:hypothetical protein
LNAALSASEASEPYPARTVTPVSRKRARPPALQLPVYFNTATAAKAPRAGKASLAVQPPDLPSPRLADGTAGARYLRRESVVTPDVTSSGKRQLFGQDLGFMINEEDVSDVNSKDGWLSDNVRCYEKFLRARTRVLLLMLPCAECYLFK